MTYTVDDVKRLVPEASRVEESKIISGAIEFSIDGYIGHTAYGPGPALLTTRRQLELAREALERITAPKGYISIIKDHSEIARDALDAIEKEGEA